MKKYKQKIRFLDLQSHHCSWIGLALTSLSGAAICQYLSSSSWIWHELYMLYRPDLNHRTQGTFPFLSSNSWDYGGMLPYLLSTSFQQRFSECMGFATLEDDFPLLETMMDILFSSLLFRPLPWSMINVDLSPIALLHLLNNFFNKI